MIASFTRGYTFSASHRLHTDLLSPEANRAAFGKCNNPHGHGHNYRVFVTVSGPISPQTGMVINMATLDAVVREHILSRFDHRNLNLDPGRESVPMVPPELIAGVAEVPLLP